MSDALKGKNEYARILDESGKVLVHTPGTSTSPAANVFKDASAITNSDELLAMSSEQKAYSTKVAPTGINTIEMYV